MSGYDEEEPRRSRRATRSKYKEVVSYTHFEEVLERINPFGPFQIFACICIQYVTIEWAGNYMFVGLLGFIEPNWECTLGNGTSVTVESPTDDTKCAFIEANCNGLTAIKSSTEFYSLVAAWQLICDNKYKPHIIQLAQAVGGFIGSFLGGHVGDHFGRKKFFFTAQLCIIITSVMVTAATSWLTFAICMFLNAILYGMIEVTSMTLMVEYTNDKYRFIPNACFQWPLALMVISLIAFLTRDWQYFFIFLNLVTSPIAIAFMLFYESPRWLVATDKLERACGVLEDIASGRWNDAKARFTANDLNLIPRASNKKKPFYNIYHLFCTRRLFKQTVLQLFNIFTYGMVGSTMLFTMKGLHDSAIMFTFLDGLFRFFIPPLVIFLDFKFVKFGRKMQLIGSLAVNALCFAVLTILMVLHFPYDHVVMTVLLVIATVINESAFWMNIVQITAQRYPTVIRCIAFGCIHAFKHVGFSIGLLILKPFLAHQPIWSFAIPLIFIVIALLLGVFLQPETKGKAFQDQLIETHFGRLENEIPKAMMRLAAGHRFNQVTVRERLEQRDRVNELKSQQRRHAETLATAVDDAIAFERMPHNRHANSLNVVTLNAESLEQ